MGVQPTCRRRGSSSSQLHSGCWWLIYHGCSWLHIPAQEVAYGQALLQVFAGCNSCSVCLPCSGDACPQLHSAAQNTRGVCFHEGAAATAVALWSAVGAQQKVLEEHGVTLEQGLCHELGLNSQTHKAGTKSEHSWAVVESPLQDSPGKAPSQPSRIVPSRVPSAACLASGWR